MSSLQSISPKIGVIGAFDTKGEDYTFICDELIGNGCEIVAIDTGVFEAKVPYPIQISCEELLKPSIDIKVLRLQNDRPNAINAIKTALKEKILAISQNYGIVGLIGAGGTNGTDVITCAMQQLPRDMPKVIISTVAQHENWDYTQVANIKLLDSCVDVGGLNSISRARYSDAAAIIACLAKKYIKALSTPVIEPKLPSIGISMFGNTTKCVERCSAALRARKFQVMPFHAIGTGGKNLETLVREGAIRGGVLDLTLQEIAAFIGNGHFNAGEGRLSAPGDTQTPHLVVPGCVDMIILGPIEKAKRDFPGRHLYKCNDSVTAMRTTLQENQKIGLFIARKVNAAISNGCPVAILIPGKGLSMFEETLQGWKDPHANQALVDTILKETHPEVPVKILDAYINDEVFADAATEAMLKLIERQKLDWQNNRI